MILRRITEHVKAQNWTAVALDFAIVVVGVFMGIQLGNWNDARANAAMERTIIAGVLDDVESDIEQLDNSIDMGVLGAQAANHLLIAAELEPFTEFRTPIPIVLLSGVGVPSLEPAELSEAVRSQIWTAICVRYFPPQSDATLSGLIAAGNLSLIQDTNLVQELQKYNLLWTGMTVSSNGTYRPFRDRLVFVGQEYGLSPFKRVSEEELVALVKANPKLEGAVRTMLEYGTAQIAQMVGLREEAETLAGELRAALDEQE
ncbi:MAG: hypothetical protein AAF498_04205 [Pseudomonadota bacterium]